MPTKPKTPITASALIKELRAIASGLAHAGQSDMLNHDQVCTDTAKSIRAWLRKVELTPTRVIITLKGGLVADVHSSDPHANVSVLDQDVEGCGESQDPEGDAALVKEIATLTEVR